MARFVVRRLIAMILVMFIVSVLTFVHARCKIPGGDPGAAARRAERDAGRGPPDRGQVRVQQADLRAVRQHDEEHLHGQAYSYTQGFNVLDEIKAGLPATLSLAIGAGIFWLLASILVGTLAAVKAGRWTDRC